MTENIKQCRMFILILLFITVCINETNSKNTEKSDEMKYKKGTYKYDLTFLNEHGIETIELTISTSGPRLLLAPGLQGRVMTSSAKGDSGKSFGWINYKFIEAGITNSQFNPYGGEERFWLGPEGGPYSIYFPQGKGQTFENWVVPRLIDTEAFEVKEQTATKVKFEKSAILKNTSGSEFKLKIGRNVSLLSVDTLSALFKTDFPNSLNIVAYQSENSITNQGNEAWTREKGLLSIWMLSMFNPSPTTTVFIPYKKSASGTIVNDDYFGKVPADRLMAENGVVYFSIDGKLRTKIGIPPARATELCGSYDSQDNVLTLLWCSLPTEPKAYVNSKWGKQDNPFEGDAINSYNDGPVADGSIMGPFYEIETSSPAADLKPGETLTHIQRVVHIQGNLNDLARIVKDLFDLELRKIATKFQ